MAVERNGIRDIFEKPLSIINPLSANVEAKPLNIAAVFLKEKKIYYKIIYYNLHLS